MSLEADRLNPMVARIRELEVRAERAEAERDAAAEILYGEPLQSRLAAADRLAEAARKRLNVWTRETYDEVVAALADYEAARKGEEGGR